MIVAHVSCLKNLPIREVANGVMTYDENGEEMVASKVAAAKGISQVTTSRIIMAAPGMS